MAICVLVVISLVRMVHAEQAEECLQTLVGASVTIGGDTTRVEIPGALKIGGGYTSNGVTLEDGNIKLHGNIQMSGNITAEPGTEATDREKI